MKPIHPGDADRIRDRVKEIMGNAGKKKVVLGWSGGIDSTASLFILAGSLDPADIYPIHLPYGISHFARLTPLLSRLRIPAENAAEIPITGIVGRYQSTLAIPDGTENGRIRLGNIMARVRMTVLYDAAKAKDALVCGTENRTEHLLGYFTRFGDAASDFEPIQHLYKTQVVELASLLHVPREFIDQAPTAGLWDGQTDEGEFGFTYREADEVLSAYVDEGIPVRQLQKSGYRKAEQIIARMNANRFKHETPYSLSR